MVAEAEDDVWTAVRDRDCVATRAEDLLEANRRLVKERFDVVVLAWPTDTASWCERARAEGRDWPILVVTSDRSVWARTSNLESGADDALPRPVAPSELHARLRALFRRSHLFSRSRIVRADVRLDFTAHRAWRSEQLVTLTPLEWKIVEALETKAGRVVRYDDILAAIHGTVNPQRRASLEVLIGRIRKKLGSDYVRTVRSEGYTVG